MPREKKGAAKVAVKPAALSKRGRPKGSKNSVKSAGAAARQLAADQKKRAASAKTPAVSRSHQPGISITVQIPPLRRQKPGADAHLEKPAVGRKRLLPVVLLPLLVAMVIAGFYVVRTETKKPVLKPTAADAATRTQPDYEPLVPSATQANAQTYDGKKNLVSYTTTFSEARVTVSQQPLPANFAKDPNALFRSADSINAKQKIDTADGPVYIATSETDGSQMALFASKTVLVFMRTDKKLDDVSWKSFIELLTQKSWQEINKQTNG